MFWFDEKTIEKASETVAHVPEAVAKSPIQQAMDRYFDTAHLFAHVQDQTYFEVPKVLGQQWHLPQFWSGPLVTINGLELFKGQLTKFMFLELFAAGLLVLGFVWLAGKISGSDKPLGRVWNLLESFVMFIRDEVARPAIGKHDADRFLPFLLTLFFFILTLNLFGMIPFLGSATGALAVTAVLAVITFVVVVGSGVKKMGLVGFLKAQAPHMDLHPAMAIFLVPGIWAIEMFGLLVKHFVLCVRLFANMFAGHLVLAVFAGFIGVLWGSWMIWGLAPVVWAASIALSVLELIVAFIQAYVFTFLTALFIGSAQHAH